MQTPKLPPRQIHPGPQYIRWNPGLLPQPAHAEMKVSAAVDAALVRLFKDLWDKFTLQTGRLTVSVGPGVSGWALVIQAPQKPEPVLPVLGEKETYRLEAAEGGIAVRARDRQSLIHAWMTLLQLLAPKNLAVGSEMFSIPYVSIADWPAMEFRGIHVCVFPETKLAFLRKVLQLAGLLKYSHVVLEFWGTLQLEAMKELAWPQALSKAQAGELVQLADSMGLQIVPMFNVWGHAAASRCSSGRHVVLDQNPRLAPLFEPDGWTWCLTNPSTCALLKEILHEICDFAGPGDYFHLGCDEAYSHATCDECRQHDSAGLLARHINAMAETLGALSRRPIIWGDGLLDSTQWGKPLAASSRPEFCTHHAIDTLSRKIIIADWQYDSQSGPIPTLDHFASHGFEVLASPWHTFDNARTLAAAARRINAKGMLITTWNMLPRQIVQLFFSASLCWAEDLATLDLPQYQSIQRTTASHYTRILSPAHGNYHDAGWSFYEVHPWDSSGAQ